MSVGIRRAYSGAQSRTAHARCHVAGFRDERETDRLIREEQDHAYQRSLIDDQLREAAAAQEQRRAADVIRNWANPTS